MSAITDSSAATTCQKLPFCQYGNSCCAVSLYACLAIGTKLGGTGQLSAENVYSNVHKFQSFVHYGYLLWKIAVVTERTNNIIDALVDVRGEHRGEYAITPQMRPGHYMYASLEEAFLKCLNGVVEAHTQDVQICPDLSDVALRLERPINAVNNSSLQMVDSLVRNCFMLQDAVVTDRREHIMEMVFDRGSAEVQKRYRLLQSIFAECPEQRRSLDSLDAELMQLYAGVGNPHNFLHLVMKQCDFLVWTMYLCSVKELVHYDQLLRCSRNDWYAQIYGPLLQKYPESAMFIRDKNDEAEVCSWLMLNLELYLQEHNYKQLCNPTRTQIMPAVHFVMLHARNAFLLRKKGDPGARMCDHVYAHWNCTVDPLCPEELLENVSKFCTPAHATASFVITSSALRSFSIHAFSGTGDSATFLLFDSHGDLHGNSSLYMAKTIEGISELVKKCAGGQRCDVNYIATTTAAERLLTERSAALDKFFTLYSYDFRPTKHPADEDDLVAFEPLQTSPQQSDAELATDNTSTFVLDEAAESDEAQELEVEI